MKLAIVTGGSKGLGLSLAELFEKEGFRVIEFSRTAPKPYSVQIDLSSPPKSREAVKGILSTLANETFEEIFIVNNAGTLNPIGPSAKKTDSAVLDNLNINFSSAIYILTEMVGQFQEVPCRKVIANISSGAALKGYFGWSLYCAAKAGLDNFIHSVALEQNAEVHPFIPININPGLIDTDMQAVIRAANESDFRDIGRFVQMKEDGMLVSADKVAASIFRILTLPKLRLGGRYETNDYAG